MENGASSSSSREGKQKEEEKREIIDRELDYKSSWDIDDVLMDVFLRLPRCSILSCRLVCKQWLHVTTDETFLLLLRRRDRPLLGFFRQPSIHSLPVFIPVASSPELQAYIFNGEFLLENLASCSIFQPILVAVHNGLLLLLNLENGGFVICNPVSKQWVSVSPPPWELTYPWPRSCIAFSSSSHELSEFKVMIASPNASGAWASYESRNEFQTERPHSTPVYVNGVFYWHKNALDILSFDEKHRRFEVMKLPLNRPRLLDRNDAMGESEDGTLCYAAVGIRRLFVWVMKEHAAGGERWHLEHEFGFSQVLDNVTVKEMAGRRRHCCGSYKSGYFDFVNILGFVGGGGRPSMVLFEFMGAVFSFAYKTRMLKKLYKMSSRDIRTQLFPYELVV